MRVSASKALPRSFEVQNQKVLDQKRLQTDRHGGLAQKLVEVVEFGCSMYQFEDKVLQTCNL